MATQGERQDYMWRPNDNSSTTITRYDQEAEHWYNSLKNAKSKDISNVNLLAELTSSLGLIFYPIAIVGLWIFVIYNVIRDILKWFNGYTKEDKGYDEDQYFKDVDGAIIHKAFYKPRRRGSDGSLYPNSPSKEAIDEMFKDLFEEVDRRDAALGITKQNNQ